MARREPTIKLSTMRTVYGLLSGMMVLQFLMNIAKGDVILAVVELVVAVVAGWYAISPPKFVRKRYIED